MGRESQDCQGEARETDTQIYDLMRPGDFERTHQKGLPISEDMVPIHPLNARDYEGNLRDSVVPKQYVLLYTPDNQKILLGGAFPGQLLFLLVKAALQAMPKPRVGLSLTK